MYTTRAYTGTVTSTSRTNSWLEKPRTTADKTCCSLDVNIDVDVGVSQLSVPPQVAQTVAPQRHQQRPTQTSTANQTAAATTSAFT